jgi:hypothetical protein
LTEVGTEVGTEVDAAAELRESPPPPPKNAPRRFGFAGAIEKAPRLLASFEGTASPSASPTALLTAFPTAPPLLVLLGGWWWWPLRWFGVGTDHRRGDDNGADPDSEPSSRQSKRPTCEVAGTFVNALGDCTGHATWCSNKKRRSRATATLEIRTRKQLFCQRELLEF